MIEHKPTAFSALPRWIHRVLTLLSVLWASSCFPLSFSVEVSAHSEIQGSGLLSQLMDLGSFVGFEGMDISESREFEEMGVMRQHIRSLHLRKLSVEIVDPDNANFDFLSQLSFFVEAEGLPKQEVARLDSVAKGTRQIELEVVDLDIGAYAREPKMTLSTKAVAKPPKETLKLKANASFDVGASL